MSQVKTEQRRAGFLLPELPDRFAIGRMCCVVPCEDLIEQELGSWPGVEAVKVNQPEGRVEVVLSQEPSKPRPTRLVLEERRLRRRAGARVSECFARLARQPQSTGVQASCKEGWNMTEDRHPKDDSQTTKEGVTIDPTDVSGLEPQEKPKEEDEGEEQASA